MRRGVCLCASSQIAAQPQKHTPRRAVRSPRIEKLGESPSQGQLRCIPKFQGRRRGGGGEARARPLLPFLFVFFFATIWLKKSPVK